MFQFVLLMMQPTEGGSASAWTTPVFFLLLFVIMYFFMIRPQSKKAKDQKKFIEDLQKGDKIVTVSGMHGRISRVNENGTVEVEIDTNTKIMMERSGISMEYTRALQKQGQPAQK